VSILERTFADESDGAVRAALLAERHAYDTMRELVPDLALPVAARRPTSAEQQAAIDRYHELRELLEAVRGAHRRAVPRRLALLQD
jgi:hypothetical protein